MLELERFASGRVERQLDLANDASVPSQYGRVARSRAYGDWHHWLNAEDRAQINRDWGDTLAALGYEPCGSMPGQSIPRGSSLDYVAQFEPAGS